MVSAKVAVFFCLVAAASAAVFPAHTGFGGYQGYQGNYQRNFVPIVSQDFQIAPDGSSYKFNYVSGDGSQRQEAGAAKGPDSYGVSGSFSYNLPDGHPVQVNFVSDEFGYQPSGPGVHPDIAKAVAEQVAEARSNPHSGAYGGSSFGAGGYRPVYG